ncbi:MAG: ABC transporter ATP-binding protein [Bacteroidota bacterium]
MEIALHKVSKRFRFEWIFKNIDYTFQTGQAYAILGSNGTGKSTLLKILSGHLTPSKGKIEFLVAGQKLDPDRVYQKISYAAPYIELIEELTLKEAIDFHRRFKTLLDGLDANALIELLGFQSSIDKEIKYFSSGMKQRLKLVLAICSDCPILLLDEPTTNLDEEGMEWYHHLIKRFGHQRLIIIASNLSSDYTFCQEQLHILDYK